MGFSDKAVDCHHSSIVRVFKQGWLHEHTTCAFALGLFDFRGVRLGLVI